MAWSEKAIERDEHDPLREYIPLPGGWEIQTKTKPTPEPRL